MGMAKFCSNCGAARAEGTKFCKDCGQRLLPANPPPFENQEELIAPTQTEGAVEAKTENVVYEKTESVVDVETENVLEEKTEGAVDAQTETVLQAHVVDVETENVLEEKIESVVDAQTETVLQAHVVDVETENVLEEKIESVVDAQSSASELIILTETAASTETTTLSEQKQPLSGLNQRLEGIVKQRTKKPLIYASALIGVVLLSVVAWAIFGSSSSKSSPLVYVKDFELMLLTKQDKPIEATRNWLDADKGDLTDSLDLSSDGETTLQSTLFYQMSESTQQWIKLNASGNRMFYLSKISDDGTANLYYSNPAKVAKAGDKSTDQGVRIASNLSIGEYRTFQISTSGDYAIYMKNYEETTGGSLYLYNMKEEVLIDNNVSDGYSFSEDDSSIIYMKTPDDETYDLYTKSVDSKSEKVKIDSDINNIVNYSSDLKTIYYTKSDDVDDESENLNINSLYVKQAGKDKQKLISDYTNLESSSMTGEFYFTRTTMNNSKLIDWVEDDMAAEDLKITEPTYSDFEHETTNTDYWGDTYTTEEVDYEQYYAAMDLYDDKLQRDSLRSDLKNEELSTSDNQLFLYAEGKETEISNEFSHITYADAASKSVIYVKSVDSKVDKVKLSEISSIYDVKDLFENNTSESKGSYIVSKGAPEQEMPEDAKDSYRFTFSDDGKKIYYTEGDADSSTGTLVAWDLLEGKLSNRKVIDENVNQYMMVNDNEILYYKDVKDGQGELLTYSDGKKVKIAYDVQLGYTTFYPNDDVLLYMTDFNDNRLMGSLFMKRGEKSVKVSDDVNFYNYNKGTHLFYLSDYRLKNGEGDLWEYLGSDDKKLIDNGVQTMLPMKYGLTF